jgi:hypothetical protein
VDFDGRKPAVKGGKTVVSSEVSGLPDEVKKVDPGERNNLSSPVSEESEYKIG